MAMESPRVLVVEDDIQTAEIIGSYLRKNGYDVTIAHDGKSGLRAALEDPPALVVLDLLLPTLDGLQVCQALRARSPVPIIMLTALNTEQVKLKGLDLGADNYLTKPFSPRELVARVRSVLRRTAEEGSSGTAPAQNNQALTYKHLVLDRNAHSVSVQGRQVRLTPTEFRLLDTLMREPGRLFSRSQLVDNVLGYDYEGMDRTIDVHVLNLRRKIESTPGRYKYIQTVYGGGYRLSG